LPTDKKFEPKPGDTQKVEDYLRTTNHPFKDEMAAVRDIILGANGKISERIKWNAPSFFYRADMAAVNPHTIKFLQVVFIFPKGLVYDRTGLLQGDYKDRRIARFNDMDDVLSKQAALQQVVNDWVALIDQ
jgi:hypothetical protein